MPAPQTLPITRQELIALLNEDLAREYQAIIAYINYSQVIKGAQYMSIAKELEVHAGEELSHALIIASQIDYLGGMPTVSESMTCTRTFSSTMWTPPLVGYLSRPVDTFATRTTAPLRRTVMV